MSGQISSLFPGHRCESQGLQLAVEPCAPFLLRLAGCVLLLLASPTHMRFLSTDLVRFSHANVLVP